MRMVDSSYIGSPMTPQGSICGDAATLWTWQQTERATTPQEEGSIYAAADQHKGEGLRHLLACKMVLPDRFLQPASAASAISPKDNHGSIGIEQYSCVCSAKGGMGMVSCFPLDQPSLMGARGKTAPRQKFDVTPGWSDCRQAKKKPQMAHVMPGISAQLTSKPRWKTLAGILLVHIPMQ